MPDQQSKKQALAACLNCGSSLAEGDAFCGDCGQVISPADSSAVLPVAAEDTASTGEVGVPRPRWPDAGNLDSTRPATARSWVQAGTADLQAAPKTIYFGQRLLYNSRPESPFDPIVNWRFHLQMAQKALLFTFIWVAGGIPAWIVFGIISLVIGPAGLIIGGLCTVATWLVLGCCFWLLPLPALLSEWKFLADGKAEAGLRVFEHIAWLLGQRQTPLDALQVRRLNLPGEGKRDYLELKSGIFAGYVACFPFGEDLYVGWTFWVSITPLRWLLMVLARLWQTITNRGTDLYVKLRFDSARAMREAMHSSAQEGIDVANGQLAGQGHGIIGTTISVLETARIPD